MKISSDAIISEEKLTHYFFSSLPSQQVDHVVIRLNGRVIGRDGKPIQGSLKNDPVSAHIPLKDWLQWKTWNSP